MSQWGKRLVPRATCCNGRFVMREILQSLSDPTLTPRTLCAYLWPLPSWVQQKEGLASRRVPLWLYHSINNGRTHSRGAHSSSSQQPAQWTGGNTHRAELTFAHRAPGVFVCGPMTPDPLCSWGKWWRHPTDPLQTSGETLMSPWTWREVCAWNVSGRVRACGYKSSLFEEHRSPHIL